MNPFFGFADALLGSGGGGSAPASTTTNATTNINNATAGLDSESAAFLANVYGIPTSTTATLTAEDSVPQPSPPASNAVNMNAVSQQQQLLHL